MEKMTAEQIKKAIIEKKVQRPKPIESAEILGIRGFLFRSSSFNMEAWRELASDKDPQKSHLAPAKLIQISFCDEAGTPVFEDLDMTLIAGIDDAEIRPVYNRCMAINGFGREGAEVLLKNLLTILGADGVYALLESMDAPCPNCIKATAATSSKNNGLPSSSGPQERPPKGGGPS